MTEKNTVTYTRSAIRDKESNHKQEAACRLILDQAGGDSTATIVIHDTGSGMCQPLPGMQLLLKMVHDGSIGVVVVASLDRLTRNAGQLKDILEKLRAHNVEIICEGGLGPNDRGDDLKSWHRVKTM